MAGISPTHVFIDDLSLRLALCVNGEVVHVAGMMAFGIFQPMLFIVRIEMWASRFEIRRIALCVLVDVDGMLSGRQIVQVELDHHALFSLVHKR